jgi:protein O-mannosyl-transferase
VSKISKKRKKPVTVKGKTTIYYYLALLVIVPLILNWKVISYEFTTSDDTTIIENNYGFLSDLNNSYKAFEKDNFLSKEGTGYYRPVQTISFMIDTKVGANVYHFSNLFYHILTVIVLFLLLRKLEVRDDISFFISLLFSVHPLLTDAIAWIPGRGDLLSGLFCSLSFLIFIYYNNTRNKWYFIIHSLTFALALFSKEISVFLPVIIIYYYYIVLKNRFKIRVLVPFFVVWIIPILLFFLLRHLFLNYQNLLSFKALIRSLPVIPIFISKLVIPIGLSPMPVYKVLYIVTGIIISILSGIYIWKLKTGNRSQIGRAHV